MDFYPQQTEERHPIIQLLFLAFLAFGGVIVFAVLASVFIYLVYGMPVLTDIYAQELELEGSKEAFKILLVSQQLGLFLAPAILLGITESKKPSTFYGLEKPKGTLMLVVFWLMLFSLPFIGKINELNQQMKLPTSLKSVEDWMRQLEDVNALATEKLLSMKSFGQFLGTFFVIAIVPAVCEEFLFRGAIQRTLKRWFKNPHLAIWVSAIIFSAIHFQFYGFFTRMLLGASLGYILFFTGSLWYSIFAHFLNNAYAVALAYYLQANHKPITDEAGPQIGWIGVLISLILTLVLFKVLKDQTKKQTAE